MDAWRRNAVRLVVVALVAAAAAGCAPKRIFRDADVDPGPASAPASPPPADLGARARDLAKDQLGTPYTFGGGAPQEGFDCSGLVQWTYGRLGVSLPRSVKDLEKVGRPVEADDLRAGDLVFFSIGGRDQPDHVGIYDSRHRFVHAPRTGHVVRTESLNDAWWRRRWTSTRRID